MARKKRHVKKKKVKPPKPYIYLFHISTQPRKFLQPYRTSWCYGFDEDRTQALLFLCTRKEIKDWIEWVTWKRNDKHTYKTLCYGGYITLFIHVVRVHTPDLIIPDIRCGDEFVVKDRIRPRAIVPIRIAWGKKIDFSKLNSTLKRLNEVKVKA